MTAFRLGILGTGRMAAAMATEVGNLVGHEIEVAAVGSRDGARARQFAATHRIARAYASYAALATDPGVDAIYVATPPSHHERHVILCLESGKHVLCEKPFALNVRQAERMVAVARESGRFLMEAMWTALLPAVVAVRELIGDGQLGRPQLVIAGGAFVPGSEPAYLLDPALGGGALLDAGVYLVYLVQMFLGEPSRVLAAGALGVSGVDEQDVWVANCRDGSQALLYVSLRARRAPDLEILFDRARLVLHAPVFRPTRATLIRPGQAEEIIDYPIAGSGYGYPLREMIRCIRSGERESPALPLAQTLAVMSTMDGIRRQIGLRYPDEQL